MQCFKDKARKSEGKAKEKRLLTALLAFFDLIAPVLTFLCIKKPETEDERNNAII